MGVDGWKDGWVAVVLQSGIFHNVLATSTIPEIVEAAPDAQVIGIDIPMGFPLRGRRPADVAAREFLGSRRSSVFLMPPRAVIEASTYEEARETARRVWDQGVSAQSYALREKILEVDRMGPIDAEVIEVHPEVSFQEIARQPLSHSKRTWNGQRQRQFLLESEGIFLPDRIDGHAGHVPADDLLDAAVVAWTANRYLMRVASSLPEQLDRESDSVIWY